MKPKYAVIKERDNIIYLTDKISVNPLHNRGNIVLENYRIAKNKISGKEVIYGFYYFDDVDKKDIDIKLYNPIKKYKFLWFKFEKIVKGWYIKKERKYYEITRTNNTRIILGGN